MINRGEYNVHLLLLISILLLARRAGRTHHRVLGRARVPAAVAVPGPASTGVVRRLEGTGLTTNGGRQNILAALPCTYRRRPGSGIKPQSQSSLAACMTHSSLSGVTGISRTSSWIWLKCGALPSSR